MKTKDIKLAACVLLTSGALLLGGCNAAESATEASSPADSTTTTHTIIIDCDGGGDDAASIIALAQSPNIKLLGITCVEGNTDLAHVGASTLMDLQVAERTDVAVYLGCSLPDQQQKQSTQPVYGLDGMGDKGLIHPNGNVQDTNAVDFIVQTVSDNPDKIEIVVQGPATNIAAAIRQNPQAMSHVKQYWIMGTAGLGVGNATPVAEFNVYSDPDSFATLLDNSVPKVIVPFDTSVNAITFQEDELADQTAKSQKASYIKDACSTLFDFNERRYGMSQATICDFSIAACLLDSSVITQSTNCHGVCVTDAGAALGQVIFFQEGIAYEALPDVPEYDVQLILAEDSSKVKQLLKDALR